MRTAFGFLENRLVEKLPAPPAHTADLVGAVERVGTAETAPPSTPPALIACAGPGEEHVFRPAVPWATTCGPCHREERRVYRADVRARAEAAPEPPDWREPFAAVRADGDAGGGGGAGGAGAEGPPG